MRQITINYAPAMLAAALALTASVAGAATPTDTYFSLAVTENSHNHYGENLLFLDFQETPDAGPRHPRTVVSSRVANGSVQLDGALDEWDEQRLTRVRGRVMNNFPLSFHRDAVSGEILVGSAFDDNHVYFVVQWEDANHDASVNRNRWIYQQGEWRTQSLAPPREGALASLAVNAGEMAVRSENEDRVLMLFPIVDQQANFRDGGLGCAGYCHTNLVLSVDPAKGSIGDGAAAMHTAVPDDKADIWHWQATRTAPMNTLKDGHMVYGDQSFNGRITDDGEAPYDDNGAMDPFRPVYVHKGDYEAGRYNTPGHASALLTPDQLLEITPEMQFAEGVSIPFYIHKPGTGSLNDVSAVSRFDAQSKRWTVEFRRALDTGDDNDRNFLAGPHSVPPTLPMVKPGDPARGAQLYEERACAACHGEQGEGTYEPPPAGETVGRWQYPRNQRVSAPLILKSVSPLRPERLMSLAYELSRYEEDPPEALMPFVDLTPQEAEDIAAFLQQQFIPLQLETLEPTKHHR